MWIGTKSRSGHGYQSCVSCLARGKCSSLNPGSGPRQSAQACSSGVPRIPYDPLGCVVANARVNKGLVQLKSIRSRTTVAPATGLVQYDYANTIRSVRAATYRSGSGSGITFPRWRARVGAREARVYFKRDDGTGRGAASRRCRRSRRGLARDHVRGIRGSRRGSGGSLSCGS